MRSAGGLACAATRALLALAETELLCTSSGRMENPGSLAFSAGMILILGPAALTSRADRGPEMRRKAGVGMPAVRLGPPPPVASCTLPPAPLPAAALAPALGAAAPPTSAVAPVPPTGPREPQCASGCAQVQRAFAERARIQASAQSSSFSWSMTNLN